MPRSWTTEVWVVVNGSPGGGRPGRGTGPAVSVTRGTVRATACAGRRPVAKRAGRRAGTPELGQSGERLGSTTGKRLAPGSRKTPRPGRPESPGPGSRKAPGPDRRGALGPGQPGAPEPGQAGGIWARQPESTCSRAAGSHPAPNSAMPGQLPS
ncbi:hypothetical protein D3105_32310 [Streptomyces globisporus]|uniref:Uncharacterized protein n=1 Tax=Streptomyces globisporus TaxID=1908 RepID=A0A423UQC8_STRGL|nr:hypothetical protein D3105_32310 [Streptomyces globisporus]